MLRIVHREEEVMGTVVVLDLYAAGGRSPRRFEEAVEAACGVLHRADEVFSTWQTNSPVSRLRRGILPLAEAPPEVTEVLQECAVARRVSGGWFDPWAMPGGVDPTGYVKGWAAQRALACLRRPDVIGAAVNAAGDIATFGRPDNGDGFRIGIVDPLNTTRIACVVDLPHDGTIATSATYERGPHLVDPRTGAPEVRLASASVCGPDLGMADALATALAVAGVGLLPVIAGLDGYEALAIGDDGWRWTPGFPFVPRSDTPTAPG